mgnify:FL=1
MDREERNEISSRTEPKAKRRIVQLRTLQAVVLLRVFTGREYVIPVKAREIAEGLERIGDVQ